MPKSESFGLSSRVGLFGPGPASASKIWIEVESVAFTAREKSAEGASVVWKIFRVFPGLGGRRPGREKGVTTAAAAAVAMGVEKQILRVGTGPKPVKGQNVTVHCTGFGKNGDLSQKFWSTKDPGQQPFSFKIGLGSVIKGWDEGVIGMQVGEVARLQCTPDYAYGPSGFPAWGIMPNSPLIFEIEVLRVQ